MQLEQRVRELYANIGKLITSSLELEDILEGIMEEVRIFFNPENWSLLRVDPTTNELFFVIIKGAVEMNEVKKIRLKIGEGIAGSVAQSGESIYVADTTDDPRFSRKVDESTGFHTRSIIAVPLKFRNMIYGVIEIVNGGNSGYFTEDEKLVLQTIADFSAIAFANSALHDAMVEASHTDPLTGLFNRARLNEITAEYQAASAHRRRSGETEMVSLIVIDLNNFKEINDKHGHAEGDTVLRKTASALRKCVRKNDMVFRIGGDEFIIILNSPDEEKVRLAEARVLAELRELSKYGLKEHEGLGFSFGVASGERDKVESLIHEADVNMYKVKKDSKVT